MDRTPAEQLAPHRGLRGTLWQHRKGGRYRVICVALEEATRSPVVVYAEARGEAVYTRPLEAFLDGRFTRLGRAGIFAQIANFLKNRA
ncbi:MAG: DUF1653 domain-containing protein [Pseudomonadota bacterium]